MTGKDDDTSGERYRDDFNLDLPTLWGADDRDHADGRLRLLFHVLALWNQATSASWRLLRVLFLRQCPLSADANK
jgi:hypothetical protein